VNYYKGPLDARWQKCWGGVGSPDVTSMIAWWWFGKFVPAAFRYRSPWFEVEQ
jgi:hypothetical protein